MLHTLIGMGSAALAAAVPYPSMATRISRTENKEVLKATAATTTTKLHPEYDINQVATLIMTSLYRIFFFLFLFFFFFFYSNRTKKLQNVAKCYELFSLSQPFSVTQIYGYVLCLILCMFTAMWY